MYKPDTTRYHDTVITELEKNGGDVWLLKKPESARLEVGMKVCWNYYNTLDDAERASAVAQAQAAVRADQGYDFGYQTCGAIKQVKGPNGETQFEVTFP